jgi:hypothetical protein
MHTLVTRRRRTLTPGCYERLPICSFRVRRLSDSKVYALKETNVKHMSSVRRVHPDRTHAKPC